MTRPSSSPSAAEAARPGGPAVPPLGGALGSGGEAEVFAVATNPGLAFKRYRRPSRERAAKLAVMITNPPEGAGSGIAWPLEAFVDRAGNAVGFTMPRIAGAAAVPLFRVYNPQTRRALASGISWRYVLRVARNVAAIVDELHRAGYVVGDLNESNLLVDRRALVTLVDCDSVQVRDPLTGDVHHCPVGKPDFLAPELHGRELAATERTPEADRFALAVLVFLLLQEGVHPFAGVWRGRGDPPDLAWRVRRARYPYGRLPGVLRGRLAPPPHAVGASVLPRRVQRLARRSFTTGRWRPSRRPSARAWVDALESAESSLRTCRRSATHEFAGSMLARRCPWCARVRRGFPDPFPGIGGGVVLPPSRASMARRRMAAVASRVGGAVGRVAAGPLRGPVPAVAAVVGAAVVAPLLALMVAVGVVGPVLAGGASWRRSLSWRWWSWSLAAGAVAATSIAALGADVSVWAWGGTSVAAVVHALRCRREWRPTLGWGRVPVPARWLPAAAACAGSVLAAPVWVPGVGW